MNILQLDRVSFVLRPGVTETTASPFKGETQSSLALWALGHKPQWFSSADIRRPVSLMLVPGVGMPGMEHKPFLWEKLEPVRSLAVEGHHVGWGSDEPTSLPLVPISTWCFYPWLCRSGSASFQFFFRGHYSSCPTCSWNLLCPGGGEGGAWVQDVSVPLSWTAIALSAKLGWLCFATRTHLCISISIIYLFLLWVDIHGFHKVITYYYAF